MRFEETSVEECGERCQSTGCSILFQTRNDGDREASSKYNDSKEGKKD